jgi:hypothetical protein
MLKKADEGWTGKNNLPPRIPPYKTPRLATAKDTRTTNVRQNVIEIADTEEKDNESEDDTQFGVVWEKMTAEQSRMVTEQNKGKDVETPHPIQHEGKPWRDMSKTIVLITGRNRREEQ